MSRRIGADPFAWIGKTENSSPYPQSIGREQNHRMAVNNQIIDLDINTISPDPNQPRKKFNQLTLEELAGSIAELGVLNPIIVRPFEMGYRIIAGERRWRASKAIGKVTISAIIRELDEADAYIAAITENIQRENLHFIDECQSYQVMIEKKYVRNFSELAEKLGIPRQRVSERMKILKLPAEVQNLAFQSPSLSLTHAICLTQVQDSTICIAMAKKVINNTLTVKQLEGLIKQNGQYREPLLESRHRAVNLRKKQNGFDMVVKYRADRPEDIKTIITNLQQIIDELNGNLSG